jgi:hypothetical protein
MQCPCGAETHNLEHEVKSLKKAQEWAAHITKADLPIRVWRVACPACGREQVMGVRSVTVQAT